MNAKRAAVLFGLCLCLLVSFAGCNDDKSTSPTTGDTPIIDAVHPPGGHAGALIKLVGQHFGASQGDGVVNFGSDEATQIDSWSDTEIEVVVPGAASSYLSWVDLSVTVGGRQSAAVTFARTAEDVLLLTPPGDDMTQPTWLSNHTIFFTRFHIEGADLTTEIWHMPADGGPMTQRTFFGAHTDFPSVKVNSPTIAYRSDHDGAFDIYLSSGIGNAQNITDSLAKDFEVQRTPSGAGGTVALSRADSLSGGIIWNIWEYGSEGFRQISDGNKDFHPTWSNMGHYVAFQRRHSEVDGAQIMTVPRVGGPEVQVTEYGDSCAEPDWNHAYDVIAFARGSEIYARKPDGTDEKQLTFNSIFKAQMPAWSTDGKTLAWVDFMDGHYVVFVADVTDILQGK